MQALFYFRRASTGLASAPKTLARAAFLLAQSTTPQTINPAHGRFSLLVLVAFFSASA